ncbi:hypothetical protein A6R68_09752, partial [Neotoma lepida]
GEKEGASDKAAAASLGVGCLEEEAVRGKEWLKVLREKTGRKDREDGEPQTKQLREEDEEDGKRRELRLWFCVPEDGDLKRRRAPQAKPVAVEEKLTCFSDNSIIGNKVTVGNSDKNNNRMFLHYG